MGSFTLLLINVQTAAAVPLLIGFLTAAVGILTSSSKAGKMSCVFYWNKIKEAKHGSTFYVGTDVQCFCAFKQELTGDSLPLELRQYAQTEERREVFDGNTSRQIWRSSCIEDAGPNIERGQGPKHITHFFPLTA